MQIIPFHTHYQLVYINFDISPFSLISYTHAEISSRKEINLLPGSNLGAYPYLIKSQITAGDIF